MKKLFPFLALITLLFSSCESKESSTIASSSSVIPLDEAIETLNIAMTAIRPQTKTGDLPDIDEILTISKETIIDGAPKEDFAYVVNYANNQGFALLAADRCLPDPIIAIIENGTMDQNMRIQNGPQTKNGSPLDTISGFIDSLLFNYLLNEGGRGNGDDDEEHPDDEPEDPGDPWYPGPESYWSFYSDIEPMVPLLWNQIDPPFNDNYPLYQGAPRKAGCVPLAISMILAYNRMPANMVIGNNVIDWEKVNHVKRVDHSNGVVENGHPLGLIDVADLVYEVGLGCNMTYVPLSSHTFAWPEDARDYLYSVGFTNATNNIGYDLDLIIDMLENNKPVFIASISGLFQGHAWIIDGMIRLRHNAETRNLLHCNMGFGGIANGYYASKVFKSSNQVYINHNYGDNEPEDEYTFNYHSPYRIITY